MSHPYSDATPHTARRMGKVDTDTIDLLRDQFQALDADGSGELDTDDIQMLTEAVDVLDAYGA